MAEQVAAEVRHSEGDLTPLGSDVGTGSVSALPKVTRFHATKALDPSRPVRDVSVISDEILTPLALGSIPYGLAYGVLAGQSGLSPVEVLLMSGLVCAGTAQFVVLGLWSTPLPVGLILLTTLVINARFLLMGTTLQAWFAPLWGWQRYSALFVLSDESWALAMSERARGGRDAAFIPFLTPLLTGS